MKKLFIHLSEELSPIVNDSFEHAALENLPSTHKSR